MNRAELMRKIQETGFALYDLTLFFRYSSTESNGSRLLYGRTEKPYRASGRV